MTVIIYIARLSFISGHLAYLPSHGTICTDTRQTHRPCELFPSFALSLANTLSADRPLSIRPMSHIPLSTPSTSSVNFQAIFDAALDKYKKKAKKDLLTDQLTAQMQACDSPSAILDILNSMQKSIQSQRGSGSTKQWLDATVHVLCGFSDALGEGVATVHIQTSFRQVSAL